uniref:Uncharacterized protein n=1 Tax=Coccidioides posadasii RMSCC 3488 TaxID=454284 RepID=A0A0J6F360_COCPO|nr:hypothetical protein CPAG_03681 [Coccidioides posadasii RMSCC 3488]
MSRDRVFCSALDPISGHSPGTTSGGMTISFIRKLPKTVDPSKEFQGTSENRCSM